MTRFFDIFFSLIGMLILLPLMIIISIWIVIDSKGPVVYKQFRVGLNGADFKLYKFRTMEINADNHGLLTVGNRDHRITNAGFFLRKYKIDELPQLLNVLIGDMSLVGPRPEVRKFVNLYSQEQLEILKVRPGITDEASILYKNENELLSRYPDPEKAYIEIIMPQKILINLKYIKKPSIIKYFQVVVKTILKIFK